MDQNVDRISREIAYVPLSGGIRSKCSSCMQFFFLSEYKICLPGGRRILAHVFRRPRIFGALAHVFKGPKVLDPGSCFQRPRILGLWLMFSEDQTFWILLHVFRGLGFWILAHVFRGPRDLGLWLMFSEDQRFWILAHVFRGLGFLDLSSCFQRPRIFWILAHADMCGLLH